MQSVQYMFTDYCLLLSAFKKQMFSTCGYGYHIKGNVLTYESVLQKAKNSKWTSYSTLHSGFIYKQCSHLIPFVWWHSTLWEKEQRNSHWVITLQDANTSDFYPYALGEIQFLVNVFKKNTPIHINHHYVRLTWQWEKYQRIWVIFI